MSTFQLKRLWKRWVTHRCRKNYTILPRQRRFHPESGNRYGSTRCDFFSGFYCATDPLLVAIILFTIFGLLVMALKGVTITDIQYKIGLGSYAAISISTLDWLDDVNLPGGGVIIANSVIEQQYANTSLGHAYIDNDAVLWKVVGFNKYIDAFSDDQDVLGMFGKFQSGKKLDKTGYGFWVFRYDPPKSIEASTNAASNGGIATISVLNIMDHAPVSPEETEVAVAIRAYVEGEATILLKYEDTSLKHVYTESIKPQEFRSKGFCFKILDIPLDKRINTIHIRPTSTNLRRHGLVIIDKVVIVMAKRDTSQKFIYTLVPDNWC